MECNNTYCLWCEFEQCCHESEEGYLNATPNQLDCPSSLRKDFQEQLYILVNECTELLRRRNMRELIEIRKFIKNQRDERRQASTIKYSGCNYYINKGNYPKEPLGTATSMHDCEGCEILDYYLVSQDAEIWKYDKDEMKEKWIKTIELQGGKNEDK